MSKNSKAVAKEMRKQRTRDAMAKRASKLGLNPSNNKYIVGDTHDDYQTNFPENFSNWCDGEYEVESN